VVWQLRREDAAITGLARQPGTSWKTMGRAVDPELARLPADETWFENVTTLGIFGTTSTPQARPEDTDRGRRFEPRKPRDHA
jgi:hypothetical protein